MLDENVLVSSEEMDRMARDLTQLYHMHLGSLGVSTRHHMTLRVVSQFRKLKKSCNDVTEGLGALNLEEMSWATQSQKLSALEQIFSFTSSHPTQFPQTHCHQFTQQLKRSASRNNSVHAFAHGCLS